MVKKAEFISLGILDDIHRVIYELRPRLVDDLGLVSAIRWLLGNNLESVGIKVDFTTSGKISRLTAHLGTTLFRVI
jgi:two-component system sensor histidine kinase DegS